MFGIGGSASKASSSSQSSEYGYSNEGSNSVSGSQSNSQSTSGSSGKSFTDIAFQDLFANLYGNASGAAAKAAAGAPALNEQAQTLFSGGLDFLNSLDSGNGYLEDRVNGSSPVLDEQIAGLGSDLGKFFREELNPAITARAVSGGTLGGGRQGVAQGRAADAVTTQFQRGATELRAQDVAQRDAAATSLMQNRTNAAGVGLNALPGLYDVAQGGFGSELLPYQQLASIMGGPTTLAGSESSSFSQSTAEEIAAAIAASFGNSENFAQSSSKSSSKSLSVKI